MSYKFKRPACILPYKFSELKESLYFVELYLRVRIRSLGLGKSTDLGFLRGARFKARPKNKKNFRDTGEREEKRGHENLDQEAD